MILRPPTILILLLFSLLTSGSGCQIMHIPSYRVGESLERGALCSGSDGVATANGEYPGDSVEGCPPGFLPPAPVFLRQVPLWMHAGIPVPAWWAEWKAKRDLPEPAPYPRFQPLPTRPIFSPRPDGGAGTLPLGIPGPIAAPWPAEPRNQVPMNGSVIPVPPVQSGYGRLP
jgi:hypothetical protein